MSASTVRTRASLGEMIVERVGRANAILGVIAGAYLMVALDSTVVNVALPNIERDLRFTPTQLAWVINAYLLTFGGLLLLGGRVGDVLGRRRAFAAGVALFTASSALAGLAPSSGWLVAARAIQGVGGALATPNTMALLATNFPEGAARNRALSVYSAVAMGGASVGLVVGGLTTAYVSWRWSILINLPIGAAICTLAARLLDDTERRPARLDVAGAAASTAAMGAIVYGLIEAASNGWDGTAVLTLAAGLVMLGLFAFVELRASQPIVPLHLLRTPARVGAYLNLLLLPAAIFGPFFFLTQFLQEVRGLRPLEAGVAFLPQTVATVVAVRFAPRLLNRYGATRLLVAGGLLVVAGVGWLARLSVDSTYAGSILGPLVLVGVGVGWSFMPLNATILTGVASGEAGAASAVAQAMQWVGGSLGLAVLVTVFGTAARSAPVSSAAELFVRGTSSALSVGALFAIATIVLTTFVVSRGAAAVSR